jgi:hypothetical protein
MDKNTHMLICRQNKFLYMNDNKFAEIYMTATDDVICNFERYNDSLCSAWNSRGTGQQVLPELPEDLFTTWYVVHWFDLESIFLVSVLFNDILLGYGALTPRRSALSSAPSTRVTSPGCCCAGGLHCQEYAAG